MGNTVSLDIIAIDSASSILQKIAGEFGPLGAAAAAGLGMATAAFGSLLQAGSETQDTMARFNSLVDSSPLSDYKDKMLELADATAKKTRFDNDSILAAEGQLAVYTSIGKTVFPDALKATVNLATYMESDAPAAAKTLGRALEAIGDGSLSLLTKQKLLTAEQKEHAESLIINSGASAAYGYELDHVTDSVRHQVDQLQAAGHMTEAYKVLWDGLGDAQKKTASEMRNTDGEAAAQAYVIDILNGKIGNLAEDMGNNFPGKLQIMQNKFQDFWQEQGSKTEEVLTPMLFWFERLGDQAMPIVAAGLDEMRIGLLYVEQIFGRLASGDVSGVADIFTGMGRDLSNLDWGRIGNDMQSGITTALNGAIGGLGSAGEFANGILKNIEDSVSNIDWNQLSTTISNGLNSIDWTAAGKVTGGAASGMAGWWNMQTDALGKAVANTDWNKILGSVQTSIDKFVGGATSNLPGEWQGAIKAMVSAMIPFDGAIQNTIKLVQTLVTLIGQMVVPTMPGAPLPGAQPSGGWTDPTNTIPGSPPPITPPTYGPPPPAQYSTGADFIVPPGYPNDTYPIRVESGEHVVVTPANRVSGSSGFNNSQTVQSGHTFHISELHVHLDGNKTLADLMGEMGAAM